MPNSVRLSKRFVFIQTLADASQNLFLGEYLTETLEHVGPSGGGFDARINHVYVVGELSSYPAPYPGDTNNQPTVANSYSNRYALAFTSELDDDISDFIIQIFDLELAMQQATVDARVLLQQLNKTNTYSSTYDAWGKQALASNQLTEMELQKADWTVVDDANLMPTSTPFWSDKDTIFFSYQATIAVQYSAEGPVKPIGTDIFDLEISPAGNTNILDFNASDSRQLWLHRQTESRFVPGPLGLADGPAGGVVAFDGRPVQLADETMLRSLGLTAPQLPDLQLAGAHLPATAVWAYGELTPLVTPASRPGVGPLPPLSKIKTLKAPLG